MRTSLALIPATSAYVPQKLRKLLDMAPITFCIFTSLCPGTRSHTTVGRMKQSKMADEIKL